MESDEHWYLKSNKTTLSLPNSTQVTISTKSLNSVGLQNSNINFKAMLIYDLLYFNSLLSPFESRYYIHINKTERMKNATAIPTFNAIFTQIKELKSGIYSKQSKDETILIVGSPVKEA